MQILMRKIIDIRTKLVIVFGIGIVILLNSRCVQNVSDDNPENQAVEIQDRTVSHIESWDTVTIKDLISLLDKHIDSLPNIEKYKKEKIIIEDDEGYAPNWFAVKYLYQNNLIFVTESNWENKNIVHRITLYSNEIKEGKLYVGQTFGEIRNLIRNKIEASPDGELCIVLNKYPEISILLDISNIPDTSPLYYGAVRVSEIPDSLKIESMVIMER